MSDDVYAFGPDTPEPVADTPAGDPWKVLIVDDEPTMHATTRFAIGALVFQGRPLQLLEALSAAAAREILRHEQDIALAMIDVVMETEHSGLDLVRFIRNELGNQTLSIIMRTGQPGYAPEHEVIIDYDINDYKSKSELNFAKLTNAVILSLRTYTHKTALKQLTQQLEAQLIQSEKMATLGLLVANVAHEINTPLSAIKSSGQGIAEALSDALSDLPKLAGTLDQAHGDLFVKLISQAGGESEALSSREKRAIVQEAANQLEAADIPGARHKAGILVNLQAQSALTDYLPLLRHAENELILSAASDIATIINGAQNINTAVDRVAKIVLALKSFSRVNQSAEMSDANVQDGIETVLTIYHHQIKQNVEVVRNYEDIPPLRCLPDELNQVWTNLIHNALQAMNHQGTLRIGIRRVSNESGDAAVISVGDSGCGIPEEIRGKIFDVFFTTKPVGIGSGLGLDIVKKIIDKHQGRIAVQSEVGVGTTFSVYLPYHHEAK